MSKISRRSMVGMITTGFVAFLFSPSVAGAVSEPIIRAGEACKKVGRRKTSGGKTFECVKTANGNTWRRAKASTPSKPTTSEVKVLDSSSLASGASQTAIITSGGNDYSIVLTRTSSGVVAFDSSCTHAGWPVNPGPAGLLTCPAHGSVFSASTGAVIKGPAEIALTRYIVSERSGAIYITI